MHSLQERRSNEGCTAISGIDHSVVRSQFGHPSDQQVHLCENALPHIPNIVAHDKLHNLLHDATVGHIAI